MTIRFASLLLQTLTPVRLTQQEEKQDAIDGASLSILPIMPSALFYSGEKKRLTERSYKDLT